MPEAVLVVGGGFAGLAAGVALAEAGVPVHLIEAKPYLGGRARSWVDPVTGCVVDNGQHLFMRCYRATLRFLRTIGTLDRIRFQKALTLRFIERGGRVTSLEFPRLPAPLHLLSGVMRSASFNTREKLEILRLGRALRSNSGVSQVRAHLTVDEWLRGLNQSDNLRRNFWDLLSIAAMNEDPTIASAALFERVLRLALFQSAADSGLGIAAVGLSDSYTGAAADYIQTRGGRVDLNRPVRRLLIERGECKGIQLDVGERLAAQAVISAVPWFALGDLLPEESLDSNSPFVAVKSLQPAPIISINLWFDRPVTDLDFDFAGLRGTTIQWLFNKGRIFGRTENYISLVVSGAHHHVSRPKEELISLALRELGELLPAARQAKVLHSLVVKERWATFSPTPEAESARPPAATPISGLYLAGDWTRTGLPATIEGAVQSGYAAADAVISSNR